MVGAIISSRRECVSKPSSTCETLDFLFRPEVVLPIGQSNQPIYVLKSPTAKFPPLK